MGFADPAHVVENLRVLGSITGPGKVLKVTVLYGALGKFEDRLEVCPVEQLDPQQTRIHVAAYEKLEELFGAAEELFTGPSDPAVRSQIPGLVDAAEQGILQIEKTYAQAPGAAAIFSKVKREIVNVKAILQRADGGGSAAGTKALETKYEQYRMSRLQQGHYIAHSSEGVCFGFCLDWISRKAHAARAKASYAISKKMSPKPAPDVMVTTLGLGKDLDPERMARKVTKRIEPLQNAYQKFVPEGVERSIGSYLRGAMEQAGTGSHERYYLNLRIRQVAQGPKLVGRRSLPDEDAKAVFDEIVSHCRAPALEPPAAEGFRQSVAQFERMPGFEKAAELQRKALRQRLTEWERQWGRNHADPHARAYLVGLKGTVEARTERTSKQRAAGHAIALYIDQRKKQLFDPNHGEFEFGFAADATFSEFCGDLWNHYRSTMGVKSWNLQEVYYPLPERA